LTNPAKTKAQAMLDLVMTVLGLAFFAVAVLYLEACDQL
jgi:hypothetical protein